jgi:hypothetical protein
MVLWQQERSGLLRNVAFISAMWAGMNALSCIAFSPRLVADRGYLSADRQGGESLGYP